MENATFKDIAGRGVLIVGLGKSGFAAARLALELGASVSLYDDKPSGSFGDEAIRGLLNKGARDACGTSGEAREKLFSECELAVVSPGFPLARPEIALARKNGAHVVGEVEFASWFLPEETAVIGISGTNGKSTVTALTGKLCEETGKAVFTGGNLGFPFSDAALRALGGEKFDFAVVELSSFMLEGIETFHPRVSCLTNLTPDHIDRYANHAAYGAAKKRVFMNQTASDFGVVNARDAGVMGLIEGEKCRRFTFGFGPEAADGARFEGGTIRVRIGGESESYRLANINLRGPHNAENAMAAVLCARLAGVDTESVQKGLDRYPGLHHRMESVGHIGGVEFINDSKATNVDSTLVALRSFDKGLLLIAGGRGKGMPYTPMVELAPGRIRTVFTIGEDAPLIEKAFEGTVPVVSCGGLETAMRRALEMASDGDKVLLSPACASYDQFKNFEVRGEVFVEIFRRLKAEAEAGNGS